MKGQIACCIFLLLASAGARAGIDVDTRSLQLSFSAYGDLSSVTACLPECSDLNARRQEFSSFRGFVSVNRDSNSAFELLRRNGEHSIELIFTNLVSQEARRWRIPHDGYQIGLEIIKPQGLAMAGGSALVPAQAPGFSQWLETLRYLDLSGSGLEQAGVEDALPPRDVADHWIGFRNRFWTAMLLSEQPESGHAAGASDQGGVRWYLDGSRAPRARYAIYVGPIEPVALKSADPALQQLSYSGLWSWLKWLSYALFHFLTGIHSLFGNWGVSIVVLSLLVQVLMLPPNRFAERVQDQVRDTEIRLAPRIREIKRQSSGAEQAERIMELYRTENVHPLYSLKSMVGLVFLVPVFIAAFNMLAENAWLAGESFLWISNLARPDTVARLPFWIPFLGDGINPLPFLMTGLSMAAGWVQNRSVEDAQARFRLNRRLWIMSLVFFLLFYTFPAGMVLYWTVNNAFALVFRSWHNRKATVTAA